MERNIGGSRGRDGSSYEDLRILKLALGLVQLGLTPDLEPGSLAVTPSSIKEGFGGYKIPEEDYPKKKQCVTEYVPVPTSEHVAEIIGRQGCKIKQLRTRSNAYIKTPERGDEPVFVVTGRKEDVELVKEEIRSAADHFSRIRSLRKRQSLPFPPPSVSGLVTEDIRVPYCVVGLVVGPKGATIKHIQHLTNTYIVTPSRDSEPVFEITGLPQNVENAKHEIHAHIAMRTGQACNPSYGLPSMEPENFANWYGSGSSAVSSGPISDDNGSGFWSEEGSFGTFGKGGTSMSSSMSSLSCQGGGSLLESAIGFCGAETLDQSMMGTGSFSTYNLFQSEPVAPSLLKLSSNPEAGLETGLRF